MSKMKIGTLKFKKRSDGKWETGNPNSFENKTVCYQGLYAVIKRPLKEKQYDVSFYNRKPRGPHFAVELKGSQYRRVGSKKWNMMNFNLQEQLNTRYNYPIKEIVYFKIKPVK